MMDVVAIRAPPSALDEVILELSRRRTAALTRANVASPEAERARHAGVAEGLLVALSLLAELPRAPSPRHAPTGSPPQAGPG